MSFPKIFRENLGKVVKPYGKLGDVPRNSKADPYCGMWEIQTKDLQSALRCLWKPIQALLKLYCQFQPPGAAEPEHGALDSRGAAKLAWGQGMPI